MSGTTRSISPLLVPIVLLGVSCGRDDRVSRFPATGKVLVDGAPAAGVEVRLHPADQLGNLDALRPSGTTGDDGTFHVGTYEKGDGAPAGRYKVTLFLPDGPPGAASPADRLGDRYADAAKSTFEATINPGENQLDPIEVRKAPPVIRRRAAKPVRPDSDGVSGIPSP